MDGAKNCNCAYARGTALLYLHGIKTGRTKGADMKVNAQNAAAIRRKVAAEKPLILHKKGEYPHRWNTWNPNVKAMMTQEVVIELWEECTVAPRADGKVEVTTSNQRLISQLEIMHRLEPGKCTGRKVTTGLTAYLVDTEAWKSWLAVHTEVHEEGKPSNEP